MSRVLSPFIATTQAMPMIALAPLLVMWFGLGLSSKVIICALVVFFPMLVNTVVGLRSIEREMTDAARRLGANTWQTLWYVEVPLALRPLLGRHSHGADASDDRRHGGRVRGVDAGLGFLMILSRTNFDAAMVFAASVSMASLSILGYSLVGYIEKRVIDW